MGDVGFDCTLSVGGQTIGKAQDVDIPLSADAVEQSVRDGDGWKEFRQGMREGEITVQQLWVPTNTGVQTVRDAWFTGAEVAFSAVDSDGWGFSGSAVVLNISRGEPLGESVVMPATLKITGTIAKVTGTS